MLAAAGLLAGQASADAPKKRALLVGINAYSVERLAERPIRYAVSDVTATSRRGRPRAPGACAS